MGMAQLSKAQSKGASAVMSISVTIIRANTVSQAKGMNVSLLPQVQTQTVSSYNSGAGSFSLSGIPNSNVLINFSDDTSLKNEKGQHTIIESVTPVYNSSDNQKGARMFSSKDGGVVTLPTSGKLHVWIGSKFNDIKKMSGSYHGVYMTTIEYLN